MNKHSLVVKAYEHMRREILAGRFAPGVPLRPPALAAEVGVSIIPIREALRKLESEHLVEIQTNRGARVADLYLDDIRDAYRTRRILEIEALRASMGKLDADDMARARDLNDQMVEAFRGGEDEKAYLLHRQLHFTFYEKSSTRWMNRFIGTLWDHTERYRRLATKLRGDPDGIGAEHAAVVAAIEQGEVEGAVAALSGHLARTVALLDSGGKDAFADEP
ncbi:MAG: GntR family transcriptional regulator [Chloroflexi bacterium]|nr:GntR family transcriptional regulator [Chloroflexota bacterium]